MKNSWKKAASFFLALTTTAILVTGCAGGGKSAEAGSASADGAADGSAAEAGKKFSMAVICSASGQNDNGYNQSACEGAKKIAAELGCEYKIVEPVNGVPAALETLAEDGYHLIFSLEYDFDALIKGVGGAKPIAEQYPDTQFVVFNDNPNVNEDGTVRHKNVTSVLFDVHEASFLAGYLSVQLNENQDKLFAEGYKLTPLEKSRAIGFVGGTNSNGILVYSYGFMQGINAAAAEYNASYDYYAKYDAGFTDPALGSTVAGTFYDNGANVVFADAGVVGDGITSKAKESGKIAIQTDANLDAQQPGHVLTSVLKITGVPVETITRAYADGSLSGGDRLQSYNIASGATGITDLTEMSKYVKDTAVWEEVKGKAEAVKQKIISGEIKVVNAQLGETFDPASCPNVNLK